jgi:hypothetical protein
MKVRELYDHICALSQDLDITIEDINVCTMIIKEGKLFLATGYEDTPENEDPELCPLRAHYLKKYLDEHKDAFDYEVYCSTYPYSDDTARKTSVKTKVTPVNLDLYTKDAVNLLAPEELDENGIPLWVKAQKERKPGFFERLFGKKNEKK